MAKLAGGLFAASLGLIFSCVAAPAHASVVTVPEPTTLGLLAAGVAAAAVGARLRKRK